MSVLYRIRQFVQATAAWRQPVEADEVERYLPSAAVALFRAMPAYDRRHALKVLHTLQAQGHTDPDLMAAALLHDVGKTVGHRHPLRLGHRVMVVLLRAWAPGVLERISRDGAEGWREPFYVQRHHAALGAELARRAGCTPRTVSLIESHEAAPEKISDPLGRVLQAVDSVS